MHFDAELYLKTDSAPEQLANLIADKLRFVRVSTSDSEWYAEAESWVFEGGGIKARLFFNRGLSLQEEFSDFPYCLSVGHSFLSDVDTLSTTDVLTRYYAEELAVEAVDVVAYANGNGRMAVRRNPAWTLLAIGTPRVIVEEL